MLWVLLKRNFPMERFKYIYIYTLSNDSGMKAKITNYGGILSLFCTRWQWKN